MYLKLVAVGKASGGLPEAGCGGVPQTIGCLLSF